MNLPHEPAARCGVLDACDGARTAPTRTHQSGHLSPIRSFDRPKALCRTSCRRDGLTEDAKGA